MSDRDSQLSVLKAQIQELITNRFVPKSPQAEVEDLRPQLTSFLQEVKDSLDSKFGELQGRMEEVGRELKGILGEMERKGVGETRKLEEGQRRQAETINGMKSQLMELAQIDIKSLEFETRQVAERLKELDAAVSKVKINLIAVSYQPHTCILSLSFENLKLYPINEMQVSIMTEARESYFQDLAEGVEGSEKKTIEMVTTQLPPDSRFFVRLMLKDKNISNEIDIKT